MPNHPEPPDRPVSPPPREAVQRWRLVLGRTPLEGDAGQREQLAAWERVLAQSGLPVAGLDAAPPRPRFVPAAPLGASISGEAELADVWLTRRMPAWRVREALAAAVPDGFRLLDAYDVWLGEAALPGQVAASIYRATLRPGVDPAALRAASVELLTSGSLPRERQKGGGTVSYDLRPFLEAIEVDPAGPHLRMTLRHDPERGIGRPEEVLAALGDRLGTRLEAAALVRERLVLAPPVTAVQQAPRGPRPGPRGRGRPDGRTT